MTIQALKITQGTDNFLVLWDHTTKYVGHDFHCATFEIIASPRELTCKSSLLLFFHIILSNLKSFCFLNMRTPMFRKGVTELSAKTSLDTKKDSNIIFMGKDWGR